MHIAHLNTARMKGPSDSAVMATFVARIEEVNASADAAPGFCWRWVEDDDAPPSLLFGEELLLVNMSVWTDIESLYRWVYRDPAHLGVMRRKQEWFDPMPDATTVCWWVEPGHRPTVPDAEEVLCRLRGEGPGIGGFPLTVPLPDAWTIGSLPA